MQEIFKKEVGEQFLLLRLFLTLGGGSFLVASIWTVVAAALLTLGIITICTSEQSMFLRNVNDGRGLLEHYGSLANLIALPLLMICCFTIIHRMGRVLERYTGTEGSNTRPGSLPRGLVARIEAAMKCATVPAKVLFYTLVFVGLLGVVNNLHTTTVAVEYYGQEVWDSSTYPGGYLCGKILLAILLVVVIPTTVFFVLIASTSIFRISLHYSALGPAEVNPLDPDGSGGFYPLGETMMAVFYATVLGLILIAAHFETHTNIYRSLVLASVGYGLIVCFVMFGPFLGLHRVLVKAKSAHLEGMLLLIEKVSPKLGSGVELTFDGTEPTAILAASKVYDHVLAMKTWPYGFSDLLQWSLPLVPVLVQLIVDHTI